MMIFPSRPTARIRSLSNKTTRITVLGLVVLGATVLMTANSSARLLGHRLIARATAIISGAPAASNATEGHALTAELQEPQGSTAIARRSHTSTRLSDGRVLIAGGDNAGGGYLGDAQVFDPASGTFTIVGSMIAGRSEHAALKLGDGRVLITGGLTALGITNTTEVFDPATGTFSSGPDMSVARAGHSATLFADGRVFLAGGDANGSAEILDSNSVTTVAANLAIARSKHSAALLLDGRVLIVGGRDTGGTDLSSMEIFDPADQRFSSPGELKIARVLPHLRVLFDGKVQIIGGNNDESMEIYDPVNRELGAYAHVLPASDTCTGLRPGILASQTRAALFHNGQADPLLDRSGHTIDELSGPSQALVFGGANSSGVVLDSSSVLASSPSSITTDKLDYAPGETVNISGRGWQPGETVRLRIHEDPHTPQERGFDIVADGGGSFTGTYVVQDYDLNMKFIVSARGLTSGWNAQTTFTDANNDAHIAPGWAPINTTVTFSTLYRKTTGGTVQHVRITLPVGYTNISVATMAFSSGTWSTPVVNQVTRTIDTQLTAGTGLATNNVDWARIDVTATTPPVNQTLNAAEWLMQTFTNTAGTAGVQADNPPVLIGAITNPTATITFVDAGGNVIANPVLQNGVPGTVRVRITQAGNGIKYTDIAVPTCFSSPSSVTATISAGGNAYDTPILVTDGFIRLSGGSIANSGTLTVQFNTTPNCTSGTYLVTSTPSTNASNPPSGTNQSVSTTGGSLTIAAGRADLSITKTDSPDPVATTATLTYTIDVTNGGPDDASAVKVVDTLPAGVTFVSATGTNWVCNNSSGTVTCNRTGGNLAPGAAPPITITVTAPSTAGTITNSATVSSPNDDTPSNNTATETTTVKAANSAPSGTDNTVVTTEDVAHTFTTAEFGFSDTGDTPPHTFQAVKITTLPTDGKLKFDGVDVTAGQFVSTADIAAGKLKFFPDANENGTPYASFTFQVQDDGGTDAGGVDLDPTPNTMTINVTSVNDEPAGTNNTVTTNEDTTYTFTTTDFGFTDPNDTPANELLAVKITTVATNGKLKLNGVDVTAGQFIAVADITTGNLQFFPDANENGSPYATFTFQVQDNGGTAGGGVDLDQSANPITVNVNSVNDEPSGADNTVTTNEDTAYTFVAAEFGFTDPNDTPANVLAAVKITAIATNGKLKLNAVDVTAGQSILVADINAGNLKFFPDANENGAPYATFTFQVQDDGGTANGGVDLDQSANTMTVDVTAVNDEPAGSDNTVTTNEDAAYTFAAPEFGFADPNDTPANVFAAVKITTVASDGKLKLNGVDVTAGQLVAVADINGGNLKFFPDANESGSPYATFTFQVQDDGGTANGGLDLDQSANTMTVNVTAVNDEPAGTNNTVITNEDTAYTFSAADFGFTDPNDTPANMLAAVQITTVASDGKLKLNGLDITAGQFVAVADINAGNLKFFPDANENGLPYATFTFQVQDDGGTANGGVDLDQSANTMTINVTAVNDEPAGTNNTVTTDEDTAYTFSAADFGFSDPNDTPANTLAAVKITTVATDGKLKSSGMDVTPGQFVSVADINGGNLVFFPDANENGTPYASFTFQLQDNGGTANGGVDLDQSPNTMMINVTAVNDAPDAVDDSATVDEDTTNNAIDVLANDTDVDNFTPPLNAGLTVIAVTQGTHGTVAFTPTGVTYTPAPNFFGTDSFTYTISDDGTSNPGHTDTATVNVTINNINDAPDAIDDSATVDEDTTNNAIDVLANDTDADNLTPPLNAGLMVIAVTQGTHGTVTFTASGVSYTPAPNYFGPDSFTYTISDNGTANAGHTDTATVHVMVTNVNDPPLINNVSIAPGVINENDSAVLNGSFSDADPGDPHTVVISWGDGSPNSTISLAPGVLTFAVSHQYKDDNPTNTASDVNAVMVTVCDGGQDGNLATSADNACAGQGTTITVQNVAPVITSANGPTTPQPAGSSITVTGNFTDVGTQDTHTCSVSWDDGTTSNGTVTETNGSGTCTATHTFTDPGVYSVVMTITDDDTGTASRPIDLQYVVIFDPSAGFITGGGWIMSPAGACQLTPGCATATGKANFGFVSKYKKGSNIPDGQTEFQFHSGDLNFHSSAYDYGSLVVAGFKAQYRGTGEINGVPGYKFVLTAYDGNINGGGGIDKFRIKITKDGVVVYDNRVGASDDLDLANPIAISGGSIVIHK